MQPTNHRRQQGGFTLIELLITVAILAIITLLAASVYGSYTAQVQAAEPLRMVSGMKQAWETEYFNSGGVPPTSNADIGFSTTATDYAGTYVASLQVDSTGVVATFRDSEPVEAGLRGDTLIFKPWETPGGGIVWSCGAAPTPTDPSDDSDLPIAGTATGNALSALASSTLPSDAMPSGCRP